MDTSDTPDLGRGFGFTPEELALNRAGRLSDRQRQTVVFRSVGYLIRGLALVALAVVLAAAVAPTIHTPGQIGLFAALCVLVLIIAGLLVRAAFVVAHPAVQAASGPLVRSGDARHPAITVGGVTLRTSYRRWKRLPAAFPGSYRAYYYGPELTLLSLERAAEDG